MFLLAWLFFAPYSYFRWDHRNLAVSALLGAGFGLIVASLCLFGIGQRRGWPAWVSGPPESVPRLPIDLSVLWTGAGLGIVIWGATRGSLQLALVGLPLIALGLFWRLIKSSLMR
jgi:hypothetical protein